MPTPFELAKAFDLSGREDVEEESGTFMKVLEPLLKIAGATALVPMTAYSGLLGGLAGATQGTPLQSALKAAWQTAQGMSLGTEEPTYGYSDYLSDLGMGRSTGKDILGAGVDIGVGALTDPLSIVGMVGTGGKLAKALYGAKGRMPLRTGYGRTIRQGGPTVAHTGTPDVPPRVGGYGGFWEKAPRETMGTPLQQTTRLAEEQRLLGPGVFEQGPAVNPRQIAERASGWPMREGALIPEVIEQGPRALLHAGVVPGELSEPTKRLVETFARGKGPSAEDLSTAMERVGLRKELTKAAKERVGRPPSIQTKSKTWTKTERQRMFEKRKAEVQAMEEWSTRQRGGKPTYIEQSKEISREALQNEFLRIGQQGKEKALQHFKALPDSELQQIAEANRLDPKLNRTRLVERLAHLAERAATNMRTF